MTARTLRRTGSTLLALAALAACVVAWSAAGDDLAGTPPPLRTAAESALPAAVADALRLPTELVAPEAPFLVLIDVTADAAPRWRVVTADHVIRAEHPAREITARTLWFSAFGCGPYPRVEREELELQVELVEDDGRSAFLAHLGDICNGLAARADLLEDRYYADS